VNRRFDPGADFSNGPRHAIIDIGSNTVRLVIFGGADRAPTQLWNEKVTAKLGKELATRGRLAQDSVQLALDGLARYGVLLKGLGIEDVQCVATAAVRDASNGPQFLEEVRKLGLAPRLLSGEEEATFGAMGVMCAFPDAEGAVADLGGGSLELTEIGQDVISHAATLPLGTLRLAAMREGEPEKFAKQVAKALKGAGWSRKLGKPLYLVGGTFRTMAVYGLRREPGVLDDPHALTLAIPEAEALIRLVGKTPPDELRKVDGVSTMRSQKLPDAAALLQVLLDTLEPSALVFSSLGLREGLLYHRLAPVRRRQDPLLAGVAAFASPRGGNPELAARIAGWSARITTSQTPESMRLRLAATMLALASMQIEPNLRVPQALNWALHKRWLACDAAGRALIAAALLANTGHSRLPEELLALADPETLDEAKGWGLAIRLCRRIGANSLASVAGTALLREKKRLVLQFGERAAPLRNRGTEKDLAALAALLGLEPAIETVPDAALPLSAPVDLGPLAEMVMPLAG